jgi:hypothetical protein
MKILEEVKYPENKLTIIAVNRKKESPTGDEGLYNIRKFLPLLLKNMVKKWEEL